VERKYFLTLKQILLVIRRHLKGKHNEVKSLIDAVYENSGRGTGTFTI
jgi:hypothetical protein